MWQGDKYVYSKKVLRIIAESYTTLYDGLSIREGNIITNPWSVVEYKADFDMALRHIGKGKWAGRIDSCKFEDFRWYGRLQQIIIADIMGIDDYVLMRLGFYSIPRLRGYAYYLMCKHLNEGIDTG